VQRATAKAKERAEKAAKKRASRTELRTAATALRAKLVAGQTLGSAEYYTLCRYKRAPNLTKLTRLQQRKDAYARVAGDASSEEEDDSGEDPEVCAGWRLSDVDTLVQRIKNADIKNCKRLPPSDVSASSSAPAFFSPAAVAPSPPAAAAASRSVGGPTPLLSSWASAT
jgi:hypothetical protein